MQEIASGTSPGRVAVGPMDYAAFSLTFVGAGEGHLIPFAQIGNPRGDVYVMGNQDRVA